MEKFALNCDSRKASVAQQVTGAAQLASRSDSRTPFRCFRGKRLHSISRADPAAACRMIPPPPALPLEGLLTSVNERPLPLFQHRLLAS